MNMTQRFTSSMFMVAALISTSFAAVQAQEMTDTEREVWAWEEACWGASEVEPLMSCFHDDYTGWSNDAAVPMTRQHQRPFVERGFETNETVFYHLIPMSVTVRGDVAILLYVATSTSRNKETGTETTTTVKWTDIAVRDGDSWSWIADHGTTVD